MLGIVFSILMGIFALVDLFGDERGLEFKHTYSQTAALWFILAVLIIIARSIAQ